MTAKDPVLNPTALAILALIGIRPITGYQLTQQARRSLVAIWPKADSVLYEHPRRLEALGLIRCTVEANGNRTRKRYRITAAGRRALRRWLASEPKAVGLEIEPLLRLIFADHGSLEDAHRAVAALEQWARTRLEDGLPVAEAYQAGAGDYPERTHLNILIMMLLGDIYSAVLRWAGDARGEMERWRSTTDPGPHSQAQQLLEDGIRRSRLALAEAQAR